MFFNHLSASGVILASLIGSAGAATLPAASGDAPFIHARAAHAEFLPGAFVVGNGASDDGLASVPPPSDVRGSGAQTPATLAPAPVPVPTNNRVPVSFSVNLHTESSSPETQSSSAQGRDTGGAPAGILPAGDPVGPYASAIRSRDSGASSDYASTAGSVELPVMTVGGGQESFGPLSPVPLPPALPLFGGALLMLGIVARGHKRRRARP